MGPGPAAAPPLADSVVLDLCGAPGSKALQLLDRMVAAAGPGRSPSGLLVVNDASAPRLKTTLGRFRLQHPRAPLVGGLRCFCWEIHQRIRGTPPC